MSYNENPPNMSGSSYAAGNKKGTTKRVVSTQKKIFFIFAVLAGLLSLLLLLGGKSGTYVLRATSDIQPQTAITSTQLEVLSVPDSAVEPDSYSFKNSSEAKDFIVKYFSGNAQYKSTFQILKGQQIRKSYFSNNALQPDEQLIQITAQPGDAVQGTIRTGDYVNIWAGLPSGGAVSLIASNTQIYAIGVDPSLLNSIANSQMANPNKNVASYLPSQPLPGSYLIKVKSNEVSKYVALVNGSSGGAKIYLTKVSGADATPPTLTPPTDYKDVICGNINSGSCSRR